MAKQLTARIVYRDRKTGRFVSKSTWKRSKAHGGTRYARQRILLDKVFEWVIHAKYKRKKASAKAAHGPTGDFHVIVTATTRTEAWRTALEFIAEGTKNIPSDKIMVVSIAKMKAPVKFKPGLAEWRQPPAKKRKSREKN